jgi:HEAT repeat protein/peptidoglycan/xylan/chitin deacetylase (PgdA/CDA1 family)
MFGVTSVLSALLALSVSEGPGGGRADEVARLAMAKDAASQGLLTAALSDADPMVRRYAIYGLQRLGAPTSAAGILPLLADKDPWVQKNAVVALGRLKSREAVQPLVGLLKDDDIQVRLVAIIALARIGDPSCQPAIVEAFRDARLWKETGAWDQADLLGIVEADWFTDRDVIPILKRLVVEGGRDLPGFEAMEESRRASLSLLVRHRAAKALVKFGDASGEDVLLEGLKGDDYQQQDSCLALGKIKSKRAVPGLIEQLSIEWRPNRKYAIIALSQIGDPSAVPALEPFLTGPDLGLRRIAADALAKIDGKRREVDMTAPAAPTPEIAPADLKTPGGKRPLQFIVLGVDDCASIEGLETLLDICETLKENGSKAVFTMWVAPLASGFETRDVPKQTLLLRRLFDLGCEFGNHTLHHNPGGRNWSSLSHEEQTQEVEGWVTWCHENIPGFTRPYTYKYGGGGVGATSDRAFTQELLGRQHFLYSPGRGGNPAEQMWFTIGEGMTRISGGSLDGDAPPVHVATAAERGGSTFGRAISGDYGGAFDFDIPEGVAMWKANFEYHYNHPRRPILACTGFHDWGLRFSEPGLGSRASHQNEGRILKAFLMDVLVTNKDKYPDTYCVALHQAYEYVLSNGDLEHTLAMGNGQDRRNPVKPSIQ